MGLADPGLWVSVSAVLGTFGGFAFKLAREKIKADRDRDLLRIALENSKPGDRREILEGLSALRPLSTQAPREEEPSDEPPLPSRLPQRRRR